MFAKTTIALAIIIGTVAGASAATSQQAAARGIMHHAVGHRWQVTRAAFAPDSTGAPAYNAATVSQNRWPGYVYIPGKGIMESCGLPTSYCWEAP